jgi:hypothetical protein
VDDVGADLIASGRGQQYAVSVKARLFRPGSRESRVTVIESDHLRKLGVFAERFAMVPLLAQVVCLADDGLIHLFLFRARQLGEVLPTVKNGYSIRFGTQRVGYLSCHPAVDYSYWREELVAGSWFGAEGVDLVDGLIAHNNLLQNLSVQPLSSPQARPKLSGEDEGPGPVLNRPS